MNEVSLIGDRYTITSLIAQGMIGPVYRGLDRQTERPVAIKVLRPEIVYERPTLLERFLRECDALRQLDHPNIVNLLDVILMVKGVKTHNVDRLIRSPVNFSLFVPCFTTSTFLHNFQLLASSGFAQERHNIHCNEANDDAWSSY